MGSNELSADSSRAKIINAGIELFSRNGYKKTSAMDIAIRAEVSKPLLFHYFGSKKSLFLYIFEYAETQVRLQFENNYKPNTDDFFERIYISQKLKLNLAGQHPFLFDFLKRAVMDTESEVYADVNTILQKNLDSGIADFLEGIDGSKFRDDVPIEMVFQIVKWCSEGFVSNLNEQKEISLDENVEQFNKYLDLLRTTFYKETSK